MHHLVASVQIHHDDRGTRVLLRQPISTARWDLLSIDRPVADLKRRWVEVCCTVIRSASAKLAVHPLRARWNVHTGNTVTL